MCGASITHCSYTGYSFTHVNSKSVINSTLITVTLRLLAAELPEVDATTKVTMYREDSWIQAFSTNLIQRSGRSMVEILNINTEAYNIRNSLLHAHKVYTTGYCTQCINNYFTSR